MPTTTPNEELFDIRKVERLVNDGTLTQDQVDAYLAALPDDADAVEISTVQMVRYDRSRASHGEEGSTEEDEG
jgi:hypothetical protein